MSYIIPPVPSFASRDGAPLENGYIFIGKAPDARDNPIAVYWDEALTIPAEQPIRTLAGYPTYQGKASQLYIAEDECLITVLEKNRETVFRNANGKPFVTATENLEFVSDLATPNGTNRVGFSHDETYAQGTIGLHGQALVSPKDAPFNAKGNGAADDTAAFLSLFSVPGRNIIIPPGQYVISGDITLPSYTSVMCSPGAEFICGENNLKLFKTTSNTFGTRWEGGHAIGSGQTGCNMFDLVGFRGRGAGIYGASCADMNVGVYFRQLCWDTVLRDFFAENVTDGVVVGIGGGNNALMIDHLSVNGFTSSGITILEGDGGSLPNVNNQLRGGYIQGGPVGVLEAGAYGTSISHVYFENCADADIALNGSWFPLLFNTYHSSPLGAKAIKGGGAMGARIYHPLLIGDRSFGMFDFDTSNVDCVCTMTAETGGLNFATGVTDGLYINTGTGGSIHQGQIRVDPSLSYLPRVVIGPDVSSIHQRLMANGYDQIVVGPGNSINAQRAEGSAYMFVDAATGDISVNNLAGGTVRQTFSLFLKWAGAAGTVSVNGVNLDMTDVADGKMTWAEVTKIGPASDQMMVRNTPWR